jgi:acetyl-CoA carboxylase biotin carboxyl carrier protein
MQNSIPLLSKTVGELVELRSPEVGLFTCALPTGSLLGPGQVAGAIIAIGRSYTVVVPPGVHGRVANNAPSRTQAPVGYGELLYELSPIDGSVVQADEQLQDSGEGGLVLRAPQTGRFYQRPGPDEPNYANPGDELSDGLPIGLIEIMKTFSQVTYQAENGLPARAKLVRFLVEDGAEIHEGDGLIEVEPA